MALDPELSERNLLTMPSLNTVMRGEYYREDETSE